MHAKTPIASRIVKGVIVFSKISRFELLGRPGRLCKRGEDIPNVRVRAYLDRRGFAQNCPELDWPTCHNRERRDGYPAPRHALTTPARELFLCPIQPNDRSRRRSYSWWGSLQGGP